MTTPVRSNPPIQPAQPPQPVQGPTPSGVGAAPSTLQGPPPVGQKSYIERGLIAIKDFFVWLFYKICFCFKKKEPPAPPPEENQKKDLLERMKNMVRREEIQKNFELLFPTEVERDNIYAQFGELPRLSGLYEPEYNRYTLIRTGKARVEQNPALLLPHLIRKMETAAAT